MNINLENKCSKNGLRALKYFILMDPGNLWTVSKNALKIKMIT
jgi:hypothetical protein